MSLVNPVQNAAGLKIFIGRNIHIKERLCIRRERKKTQELKWYTFRKCFKNLNEVKTPLGKWKKIPWLCRHTAAG